MTKSELEMLKDVAKNSNSPMNSAVAIVMLDLISRIEGMQEALEKHSCCLVCEPCPGCACHDALSKYGVK